MTVAMACTGLLGLLVFGLGLAVSAMRGRTKTGYGAREDPADPLYKLVRAHGNTIEYAPMLAVLMLVLGSRDPGSFTTWSMILATLSRYLIVLGILMCPTMDRPHPLRFVGALGTYVFGMALVAAVLSAVEG